MAADKYLKIGSTGFPTEQAGATTSTANAIPALDAGGKLDSTMMPTGFGTDSATMTAGEALSAGNLVYITSSGTVMKADANAVAKAAVGFVLASISNAASGTVYFEGTVTGLTGLTPGAAQFLSDATTGGVISTVVSGAGKIVQPVGTAVTSTTMTFEAGEPIVRA
jgi:hypothetical protein